MGNNKEKKITFSEEIDSSITGFALGISFVLSTILIHPLNIFHNTIVNRVAIVTLLIFGILGTSVEIGKIRKSDIKGLDDVGIGIVITAIPIFIIVKFNNLIGNLFCFIVMLFGIFGLAQGVIKIAYSIKIRKRKTGNKKVEILRLITIATEVIALIFLCLGLCNAVKSRSASNGVERQIFT